MESQIVLLTEGSHSIDVLTSTIPMVANNYAALIFSIAIVLLGLTFVMSVAHEQANAIDGKPNLKSVVKRLLLIFFILVVYKILFMGIVNFCENLSLALCQLGDYRGALAALDNAQFLETATNGQTKFAIHLAIIIDNAIPIIRYTLLCVLYIVGPLVIVMSIWKPFVSFLKNWFILLLQLSFWIVVVNVCRNIIKIILTQIEATTFLAVMGESVNYLIVAYAIVIILIMSVFITLKLLSAQNLELIGENMFSGAVSVFNKYATKDNYFVKKAANIYNNARKRVIREKESNKGGKKR
ncbi:MAG: hypothetical protein LBQ47_06905 [Endomicrobium sp.]|nr:hypothetical protein [Endomicrobium sp.]